MIAAPPPTFVAVSAHAIASPSTENETMVERDPNVEVELDIFSGRPNPR
jgi:hypothetical protein